MAIWKKAQSHIEFHVESNAITVMEIPVFAFLSEKNPIQIATVTALYDRCELNILCIDLNFFYLDFQIWMVNMIP